MCVWFHHRVCVCISVCYWVHRVPRMRPVQQLYSSWAPKGLMRGVEDCVSPLFCVLLQMLTAAKLSLLQSSCMVICHAFSGFSERLNTDLISFKSVTDVGVCFCHYSCFLVTLQWVSGVRGAAKVDFVLLQRSLDSTEYASKTAEMLAIWIKNYLTPKHQVKMFKQRFKVSVFRLVEAPVHKLSYCSSV